MGYKVKGGKLAKHRPKVGDVIRISYGRNSLGYWWVETDEELHGHMDITQFRHGGPFGTQQEAEKDATDTILGPQCKIEQGGMWDPAWDRAQ